MDLKRNQSDPVAAFIAEVCPHLTSDERTRAEANLRRYFEIVMQMAERIAREQHERLHERSE